MTDKFAIEVIQVLEQPHTYTENNGFSTQQTYIDYKERRYG